MAEVVVTGYASISSIGNNNAEFRNSFLSDRCGITQNSELMEKLKRDNVRTAHVRDFTFKDYKTNKTHMKLEVSTKYAIKACAEALHTAKLKTSLQDDPYKVGVIIASTYIGIDSMWRNLDTFNKRGSKYITPYSCLSGIYSVLSAICTEFGIMGYNNTINSAFVAGHSAIKCAYDRIKFGYDQMVIVIGVDPLNDVMYNMAELSGALPGKNDELECCPFGANRKGIVLGEACGVIILEEESQALGRGADIHGKISGIGEGRERFGIPRKDGRGVSNSIKMALEKADKTIEDIDFIYSSSNSTVNIDAVEGNGITQLVIDSKKPLYVTAFKSIIGETLSASGIMHTIAGLETIKNNYLPAIHALKECDEQFKHLCLAREPVTNKPLNAGIINGVGMGGDCYSILIEGC